jgi:hypothetical protein
MGTALIAWELGGGLGHLVQLAPLARGLARRGHGVFAAVRHLGRAGEVLGPGAGLLAAPWGVAPPGRYVRPPLSYAQLLHNVGWFDERELRGLCAAWRSLFALVRPDVVVFDHAPTALLAARGMGFGKVVIGSGFCVPPDEPGKPARSLRPWVRREGAGPEALAAFERDVVARANGVLSGLGAPSIERVTQVYGEVDETFLVTVPELDHFEGRRGARYWGPVTSCKEEAGGMEDEGVASSLLAPVPGGEEGGEGPSSIRRCDDGRDAVCDPTLAQNSKRSTEERPLTPALSPEYRGEGEGRTRPLKVFAYLKNFAALPELLAALEGGGHEVTVVCDGVPAAARERFAASGRVRFEDRPLDLRRAGRRFDAAVLNAGHGATAAMLLAGVPALLVPTQLEQGLLARAAVRNTGACLGASDKDGAVLVRRLGEFLEPGNFARRREAARAFARRYAAFDPAAQVVRMVERVEGMMGKGASMSLRRTVFAG